MTNQEIIEGKELIAEFMGAKRGNRFLDYESVIEDNEYIMEMLPLIDDMRYSELTRKERMANISPIRNSLIDPKIQRNEICPCGSKKKYKHCCGK